MLESMLQELQIYIDSVVGWLFFAAAFFSGYLLRWFFAGKKPTPDAIDEDVKALGLDAATFKECYDSGKYAKTVDKDIADGSKMGVRGTPSFFFGKTQGASKIHATAMLRGAQGFAQFKAEIEKLLNPKADDKKGS